MKRFAMFVFSLCFAVILAFTSAKVVSAQCDDTKAAADYGAAKFCYLEGADDDYCYYFCHCSGSAYACDKLDVVLGLEQY